jgi:hypothetical protein
VPRRRLSLVCETPGDMILRQERSDARAALSIPLAPLKHRNGPASARNLTGVRAGR